MKTYEELQYLKSLDETAIYNSYEDIIKRSHTLTFDGFTQDHRDAYVRLKFKALGGINT